MKQRIFLLGLGVSVVVISLVINLFWSADSEFTPLVLELPKLEKDAIEQHDIESSTGTVDEPFARNDFELMRTQSPNTFRVPSNMRARELDFARSLPKSDLMKFSKNGRVEALSLDFEPRGPVNIGGRTRALAIDVADPTGNTILAGGVSGGMWRTTNLGQTWTQTTTASQFPSVVSIVQDTRPGRESTWYYGSGEVFGNSASGNGSAFYRGDGIFKSTNSGQSWSLIPQTTTGDITDDSNLFRYVHRMVIDTTNLVEDEVYAAVVGGIVRTTDGFQTNQLVLGDAGSASDFSEVAITSTGKLYATISDEAGGAIDRGIWTSDDGITWQEIALPPGVPTSGYQRTTIGISPSNEDIVYFFRTEASGDDFNLFVYNDADQSMVVRPQSALPIDFGGPVGDLSTQNSYDQYVIVHPEDPNTVFLGAINLYRSTNGFTDASQTRWIGGYSFNANSQGFVDLYLGHHPDQHELVFMPNNPNMAICANDGGISLTQNIMKSDSTVDSFFDVFFQETVEDNIIVEWDPIDDGYRTGQFHTVAINTTDADFPWIVGGLQDNSTHISTANDSNDIWGDLFGGDGSFTQLTFNSLLVSAQRAQIFRYSIIEDGTDPGPISPPNSGDEDNALFINPVLADPLIPNKVFVAARGEIYYTYDVTSNPTGNDWLSLGEGVIPSQEFVTAMDASVSPGHQLVFATYDLSTRESLVFRVENTNEPDVITNLSTSELPSVGFISSLEINPRNANDITIVYSNYDIISIYNSQNGGVSWTPVGGNLEENPDGSGNGVSTRWLEVMPNGAGDIYLVGTSAGLYYTEAFNGSNTTWTQAGANTIGNVVIDMLAVRPVDGYVVVSTHGNGVYQATLDVPLQANVYADVFLCSTGQFSVFANRETNTNNFSYQWIVDGDPATNVSGAGISVAALERERTFQVRVTDNSTGESSLSNELAISPLSLARCDNILSAELPAATDIQVYPNPARDFINISIPAGQPSSYTITDLGGNLIRRGVLETNDLDVSSFANGTYVITVQSEETKVSRKFVKIN